MTEEEKKAKLAELKEKAAAKKALKAIQDREEAKANEVRSYKQSPNNIFLAQICL